MWSSSRRGFFLMAMMTIGGSFVGTNGGRSKRLRDGFDVGVNEGSFVVQLQLYSPGRICYCTGAIISPRLIITAGHCINGRNRGLVYGGTRHRDDPDATIRNIAHVFKHPKYGTAYGGYDVGIVEVDHNLDLDGRQAAVLLTTRAVNFDRNGVSLGWGSCDGDRQMVKQKAFLGFLNNADCDRAGGHGQYPQLLCYSMELSRTCPGDSGAPVLSDGYLIGIGTTGGRPYYAQNLYFYLDWINFIVDQRHGQSG